MADVGLSCKALCSMWDRLSLMLRQGAQYGGVEAVMVCSLQAAGYHAALVAIVRVGLQYG